MKKVLSDFFGCLQKRQPFFFVFILFLSLNCSSNEENIHRDFKILFKVNGIERTVFDFETEYVEHLIKTGRNDTKIERYAYLNEMIDNLLLAQTGSETGLLDHSTYLGAVTYQERKSMLDFYFSDKMGELLEPLTDEEIRLAYAKRERKVYVRQLYSQNPLDLKEPYQRLQTGEDFIDVANDFYQTEEYDSLAGYIGPVSYFGVDDAFAEAAYSTNLYEFSEPIRTTLGYHIVYVEFIEFPGMLTEDDYQYRKEGVSSQLRLRKQQLVSNDYVRTLMEGLNVEPNRDNILELRNIITNLDGDNIINSNTNPESTQDNNWTDDRIEQLAAAFDNNTVLATFDQDGDMTEFTFGDYLNWLPYLSFQESKVRTGASIGRGLRNEVIYQLAGKENYMQDERVVKDVEKRGYEILSELYQYNLVLEALSDTKRVEVPNSYRDRLIRSRNVLVQAEYWKIIAKDLQEAEQIKNEIISGDLPLSYDLYSKVDFRAIDPSDNDFSLIQQAILDTPIIGYSSTEGWLVLKVERREIAEISDRTKVADIETRYKVFNTINSTIEQLRENASIAVDTLLFDDIYEVWSERRDENTANN